MRLRRSALSTPDERPVVIMQPPYFPNGLGFEHIVLFSEQLLQIRASKTADSLWMAEQILLAGSCDALLLWSRYAQLCPGN
jgi:protein ImuA